MTGHRVFVYGILMQDGYVAATLPGYRLGFSGFATIREDDDATVYGVLVSGLKDHDLRTYDRIEGVRPDGSGFYSRIEVEVETLDGDRVRSWVYRMNDRYFDDEPGSPSLVARMHRQYDRVGHGAAAHDELDRRARIEKEVEV